MKKLLIKVKRKKVVSKKEKQPNKEVVSKKRNGNFCDF